MADTWREVSYSTEGETKKPQQIQSPAEQSAAVEKVSKQIDQAKTFNKIWVLTPEQEAKELEELKRAMDTQSIWVSESSVWDTRTSSQTPNIMMTGSMPEYAKISNTISSWSPMQANQVLGNMEKIFSWLPPWLKKFFEGILSFMKWITGNENKDTKWNVEKLKNKDDKIVLDKYGITIDSSDSKVERMIFSEWSALTKSRKENTPDQATSEAKIEPKVEKLVGNSITLEKGSIITSIKDDNGIITQVVKNKDGSTDTYTASNIKEKSPTTPVEIPRTQTI